MKNKIKNVSDFYVKASRQVLNKSLPLDWQERDLEDMDVFINEQVWEPYAAWNSDDLWEQIEFIAFCLLTAYLEGRAENI
jgi:hypothetical protein